MLNILKVEKYNFKKVGVLYNIKDTAHPYTTDLTNFSEFIHFNHNLKNNLIMWCNDTALHITTIYVIICIRHNFEWEVFGTYRLFCSFRTIPPILGQISNHDKSRQVFKLVFIIPTSGIIIWILHFIGVTTQFLIFK